MGTPGVITRSPAHLPPSQRLTGHVRDLVVIGGGVNGAGVARDATLRGIDTVLLENGDFTRGTSSASTKRVGNLILK